MSASTAGTSKTLRRTAGSMKVVNVLDTSALLNDPALLHEVAGDVVIPLQVVVELDGHKRRDDAVGLAAREVIRTIDSLRTHANLTDGAPRAVGGTVRVVNIAGRRLPAPLSPDVVDHLIVAVALDELANGRKVALVTADAALRILADSFGVHAVDHQPSSPPEGQRHATGWVELNVTDEMIDELWQSRRAGEVPASVASVRDAIPFHNGYALLRSSSRSCRAMRRGEMLLPLTDAPPACGLQPRDVTQAFAMDALADNNVPLVAITGLAGTGKSLIALAVGLDMVSRGVVDQVLLFRPITPVAGQDLGYLPGTESEKFSPWTRAVVDAIQALPNPPSFGGGRNSERTLRVLMERNKLLVAPLTHVRGRTFERAFIILDEAQNVSIEGVRTVLTRVGPESKMVVLGDLKQVDDPYLTAKTNGLHRALETFSGQRLFTHVHLDKVVRSDVAALAAELM